MYIPVRMLAFHDPDTDPKWRIVTIPDVTPLGERLGAVFHFGQNDFQNVKDCCSVSVADVVFLPHEPSFGLAARGVIHQEGDIDNHPLKEHFVPHIIQRMGFKELTWEQYEELLTMDRRDRSFCDLVK